MDAKWATLEEMGLRSVEAVAKHILQENVWESNLIPDIAGVDYFAGHQRRTNLQPLKGLTAFVDDFYVYGPLRENEIVRVRGRKPACTNRREWLWKKSRIADISLRPASLGLRRRVQKRFNHPNSPCKFPKQLYRSDF